MKKALYLYINETEKLQIIRVNNIESLRFERVIFPKQRLLFEAVPEAKLEVQIDKNFTLLISCHSLPHEKDVTAEDSLSQIRVSQFS